MRSVKSMDELKEAYRQGFPIKGKVAAVNKGGFEITIMGKSAFCPISQISHQYVDMPQEFVGQELEFLIESFDGNGRNIVVSRSKLLKLHAAERLQELRTETDSTRIYEGVVTRLESYGAFVDLQGIEGMIHISEMSFSRIKHPSDVLDKGEKVRVSILRVEGDEQKPRISLSLKATMQDPWEDAGKEFKIGETYHAVVSKLIKSGAIAQLKPGIDGYIHVSEMAWGKRIHDPSAVVTEGETVAVTILDVDPVDKKIRLSLKSKDDDPWQKVDVEFAVGSAATATVTSLKGFGAIVELSGGIEGFVPLSALKAKFAEGYRKSSSPGKSLEIVISEIDHEKRRIRCKLAGVDEQDDAGKDYEEYLQAESARKKKKKDKGKPAEVGSFGALLAAKLNEHQGK